MLTNAPTPGGSASSPTSSALTMPSPMTGQIQRIVDKQYIIGIKSAHMNKGSKLAGGDTKALVKVVLSVCGTLTSDIGTQAYGGKAFYTFAVIDNATQKAMVNGFLGMVAPGPKNSTVTKQMLMHDLTINIEGSVLHEVFITNLLRMLSTKHLGLMISGQFKTNIMCVWALTFCGIAAVTMTFNSKAERDLILAAGTFMCSYFCPCVFCDVMSAIQQMQAEAMRMLNMHGIPQDVMLIHLLQSAQHDMVTSPEYASDAITMTCNPTGNSNSDLRTDSYIVFHMDKAREDAQAHVVVVLDDDEDIATIYDLTMLNVTWMLLGQVLWVTVMFIGMRRFLRSLAPNQPSPSEVLQAPKTKTAAVVAKTVASGNVAELTRKCAKHDTGLEALLLHHTAMENSNNVNDEHNMSKNMDVDPATSATSATMTITLTPTSTYAAVAQ
ncbi:hypothetical protein BC828DRAFT_401374 [Blastocladiella britannica]|nr:hypothetical protein BC828DRAFT_401374 [Blastocladiella britannica]